MITRDSSLFPALSDSDLSSKEGYFVKRNGEKLVPIAAVTDLPFGLLVNAEAAGTVNTVALGGAFAGTAQAKLSGAVAQDAVLQLAADGSVVTDVGAGTARVIVGRALEAGVAGDLIQVTLTFPTPRS